jgi:membrane protease YdiL (CAAX protease family)
MPVWVAIVITSALFGFIHGQWNVGIDVFALSVVLCSLREITGSIWAGILLHMLKNSVAFFIIFITPVL